MVFAIRSNKNQVAIAKLKHNNPPSPTGLRELEPFFYESEPLESRDRFELVLGDDTPLTMLIRSLVGVDRNAAKKAWAVAP